MEKERSRREWVKYKTLPTSWWYKLASTSGEVQVVEILTLECKAIFHVEAMKKVTCILRLGKKDSFFGLQDLETKKIMQIS